MTRTYIKQNSAQQQVARESVNTVQKVCKLYNLSFEEWLHIMFEAGCRFVEGRYKNPAYQKQLLENEHRRFWQSWMNNFIQDDAVLLSQPEVFAGQDYPTLKMQMANP